MNIPLLSRIPVLSQIWSNSVKPPEHAPVPLGEVPASHFEAQLREGMYLGLIESYGVNWDRTKVARDILQNFYDPTHSLGGLKIETETPLLGKSRAMLSAAPEYDWRMLVHIGGTSKDECTDTIGSFGEGAKILAFCLLRDYGATTVRFGSAGWELDFSLRPLPEGSYDKPTRGLYAQLRPAPNSKGNFLFIETADSEMIDTIKLTRRLFLYDGHPEIQNPSFVKAFPSGEEFGFRVLEGSWRKPSGHFFDCGQERPVDDGDGAAGLNGLTLWTKKFKCIQTDRDRAAVNRSQVQESVFAPLVARCDVADLHKMVEVLKRCWKEERNGPKDADVRLLHVVARTLGRGLIFKPEPFKFPDDHRAVTLDLSREERRYLEGIGLALCHGWLKDAGMREVNAEINEYRQNKARLEREKREELASRNAQREREEAEEQRLALARLHTLPNDRQTHRMELLSDLYSQVLESLPDDICERPPRLLLVSSHVDQRIAKCMSTDTRLLMPCEIIDSTMTHALTHMLGEIAFARYSENPRNAIEWGIRRALDIQKIPGFNLEEWEQRWDSDLSIAGSSDSDEADQPAAH